MPPTRLLLSHRPFATRRLAWKSHYFSTLTRLQSGHPAHGQADTDAAIAQELVTTFKTNSQISSITGRYPSFDLRAANRVSLLTRDLRIAGGENPVGRKIGLTNFAVWEKYGIDAPIWSYVYDSTVQETGPNVNETAVELPLAGLSSPRIEPEIVFKLAETPKQGMEVEDLIKCIEWVAQGFELVRSFYQSSEISTADRVAAFASHAALVVAPPVKMTGFDAAEMQHLLASFKLDLMRDGEVVEQGRGADVLGTPLEALRRINNALHRDGMDTLKKGEVITTGTITTAVPVKANETWSTKLEGLALPGIKIKFT